MSEAPARPRASWVAGQRVSTRVDRELRLRHAALHTAGHLVEAAGRDLGWELAGNNHFPGQARIEFTPGADAQWRAVYDGPWNCRNKAMILSTMSNQITNGVSGQVEEVLEHGNRVIVGFRPDHPGPGSWPLDDGVRYLVVTLRGERVTAMKGCIDRQTALE